MKLVKSWGLGMGLHMKAMGNPGLVLLAGMASGGLTEAQDHPPPPLLLTRSAESSCLI